MNKSRHADKNIPGCSRSSPFKHGDIGSNDDDVDTGLAQKLSIHAPPPSGHPGNALHRYMSMTVAVVE